MCGIFGIVGRQDPELLKKMDEVLIHRGPDSSGSLNMDGISMGIRRLSIIDLEKGDQPIHNEDKSLWVVQNGEIYNYLELKKELMSRGHRFYTDSDTEVIVHAYEEYGEDCVKHFNGMFAFVIWDNRKKKLFGARDRAGIKPFYYMLDGQNVLFASEIKALLQVKSFQRKIDETSLYNYMSRLFVSGERTIFKGIRRLNPGHSFIFEKGRLKIKQYWDINLKRKTASSEKEYYKNILKRLEDSVKRRMVADVPLGAFLSGGIDSNGIVAFMAKNSESPVHTFTMGYSENEDHLTNEIPYARESSEYFGTDHKEFIIDPRTVIKDLPKIIWYFDEPYAGSLPQYHISRLARKYVKVVLCGLGGDELFGDYGRGSRLASSFSHLSQMFLCSPGYIRKALLEIDSIIPGVAKNSGIYRKFNDYIIRMLEIGRFYVDRFGIFSEDFKKEVLKKEVLEKVDVKYTLQNMFYDFLAKSGVKTIEDIVMYSDFKTQLVNEYLRYTDTLSMAHSLEARVPFLDHELIEYAATIPNRYLVRENDSKYLLKEALRGKLPPGTLERRKGYFSLPYGAWLRNDLKEFVNHVMSENRIKNTGYFSYEKVKNIIDNQRSGDDNMTYPVWNILMFMLWHEVFMEKGISHISQLEEWDMGFSVLSGNNKELVSV